MESDQKTAAAKLNALTKIVKMTRLQKVRMMTRQDFIITIMQDVKMAKMQNA